MSRKGKAAAVVGAILVLLLALGLIVQDRREGQRLSSARGEGLSGSRPVTGGEAPPEAAGTPNLLNASADLPGELEQCLGERRRLFVKDQPEYFPLMRPSVKNQALVGPIVERVMSGFAPRPSYGLECRVSSCRFSALSGDESTARAWFQALNADDELSRLRSRRVLDDGLSGISASESKSAKDSLTGAAVTIRNFYFSLPFLPASSPEEEHPFDTIGDPSSDTAPATLADCRRALADMQASLARKFRTRGSGRAVARVPDAGLAPSGLALSPEERVLVNAANESYQVRARQVSRELLADLKGTGSPGPGEMTQEESRELFRIVNGDWNSQGSRGTRVSDLVKEHKRRLARYWQDALASSLPPARAREILQALREGNVAGLSLPRPPAMGENAKGERFHVGWTDADWRN
jgi:hypothetical protein